MKKIKYFMPALAVASVASGVTPMITSCKSGSSEEETTKSYEFQFIKDKKIVEYTSQIDPIAKKTFSSSADLNDFYMQSVKENPLILANDYLVRIGALVSQSKTYMLKYFSDLKVKVSNIQASQVISPLFESTELSEWKDCTYFYSYDVEFECTPVDSDYTYCKYSFSYKDFPIFFSSNGSEGKTKYWSNQNSSFSSDLWMNFSDLWRNYVVSMDKILYNLSQAPFDFNYLPSISVGVLFKGLENKVEKVIKDVGVSFSAVHTFPTMLEQAKRLDFILQAKEAIQKAEIEWITFLKTNLRKTLELPDMFYSLLVSNGSGFVSTYIGNAIVND